jgi:tetratricopeptide (TPR) repeat protein
VRTLVLLVFASVALWSAAAAAADDVEEAIAAAMREAEQGRCDEAARRLADLEGLESRAALLTGRCRIGQGLYPEALADLDRARGDRELSVRQQGDVELYRAVALYHLERFTEAEAALDEAQGRAGDEAQLALYRGLLALQRGDADRAAPSLESAARLAPDETEPVASYYAGLAWLGASERARARVALQRVVDRDPEGPWGREAARLLESTRLFPAYARVSAGIEHDDNVRLRGAGIDVPPDEDGGDKDWRGVWVADGGVQLFGHDRWSGGLIGSYYGNAHVDVDEFDTHFPTAGTWLDYRVGPQTHARAYYTFGYAWVDGDSFLRTHLMQTGITHNWQRVGTTDLFADITLNDFRFDNDDVLDDPGGGACPPTEVCGPAGIDESEERDRDGVGVGLAADHRYLVPLAGSIEDVIEALELRGQYRVGYYDSEGDEWQYWSNRLLFGLNVELPFDFELDAWGAYERRDFDNPSTYADKEELGQVYQLSGVDREEDVGEAQVELEKYFGELFSVSARWAYVDNNSNRRVYDYDRHIVGGYLNFRFD